MDVSLQSGSKTKPGTKQEVLSPWKEGSKQAIITKVHPDKHVATSLSELCSVPYVCPYMTRSTILSFVTPYGQFTLEVISQDLVHLLTASKNHISSIKHKHSILFSPRCSYAFFPASASLHSKTHNSHTKF